MQATLRLFDQLEIAYLPTTKHATAARETHCCAMAERLITEHGIGHVAFVRRAIVES